MRIRITESQLQQLVCTLNERRMQPTVGDVKKALTQYAKMDDGSKAKKIALKGGTSVAKALIGAFPFGGTLTAALDAGADIKDIWSMAQKSKPKQQNWLWNLLTIDDDTAAIVDDEVEKTFIDKMRTDADSLNDADPFPDIDELFGNYLRNRFNNAHVTK